MHKRAPSLTLYWQQRCRLYQAAMYLIALDWLWRSTHPYAEWLVALKSYDVDVITDDHLLIESA